MEAAYLHNVKRPGLTLCALLLGFSAWSVWGEDAAPKDPVCKTDPKTGAECHAIPGSRTSLLKSYLAKQGKSALTTTNGAKVCDQPVSKAALMQKTGPAPK